MTLTKHSFLASSEEGLKSIGKPYKALHQSTPQYTITARVWARASRTPGFALIELSHGINPILVKHVSVDMPGLSSMHPIHQELGRQSIDAPSAASCRRIRLVCKLPSLSHDAAYDANPTSLTVSYKEII